MSEPLVPFVLSTEWPNALGAGGTARDIAINIVASLLFALLGAAAYRFVYVPAKRRANLLSRSLPFDLTKRPIVISYGLLDPASTQTYYMVEEGDLAAINFAGSALVELFGENDVQSQNCFVTEAHLGGVTNLLAISGPRWNRVVETFLGRIGSPVTFDKTDALVVAPRGRPQQRHQAIKRPNGQEEVCYGVVVAGSAESAAGKSHRVVICAGLNNLSTYGAVVFLMSLRHKLRYRSVPWLGGGRLESPWAAVLRVENTTNPGTFMPYQLPLDPNHIKVDVVEILRSNAFLDPYVYRY